MISLHEFYRWMDGFGKQVPLDELIKALDELHVKYDEIDEYAQFSKDCYRRNLLHEGPGYHVLVICWLSGQRSPIHDHRGSSCGVRILKGTATETTFTFSSSGLIVPTQTRELVEGSVCGSQDSDVHQVSNLQTGDAELVTLHVYTPPLHVMGTYSLTDPSQREFRDPVFEFAAGTGI